MRPNDICRLCGTIAKLQDSHIFPAAAHTHTKVGGKNVLLGNRKRIFRLKNQTDFKEPLLCFACEQLLSVFEGRAIKACHLAWQHRSNPRYQIPPDSIAALVKFVYSVFWRSSVAKSIESYNLSTELENELKDAFYRDIFPSPPRLGVSVSFLKVLDIPITGKLIFTPLIARLPTGLEAHYFSVFGIVFRMNVPSAPYELENDYFLRAREQTGCIYPLQLWEQQLIDNELTLAAVIAKSEGAVPIDG